MDMRHHGAAGVIGGAGSPLKFDSLTYHLALPQTYLAAGRIVYLPENAYSGFPQTVHMLYLWMLALGGMRPAVMGWGIGMLALFGLWGYMREKSKPRYAWVAIACLLGGYSLVSALAWAYTDWPSILVGTAFLIVISMWQEKKEHRLLLLSGILGGAAVGIKYTNALLPLIALLLIIWQGRKQAKDWINNSIIFAGVVIATASPWLLRNWAATGNPVYPLLFPAGAMDEVRLQLYQQNTVNGNWMDLVLLPLRATIFGLEGAQVADAPGYTSSIGPLLLAFGALTWLGWRHFKNKQPGTISTAAWLGLAGIAAWAVGNRLVWHLAQARLYYTFFPALAILAALGYAGLERCKLPHVRLGRVAAAFIVLVLGFTLTQIGLDVMQKGTLQSISGQMGEHDYLVRNLGGYAVAMDLINDLPAGSKVVMLWEGRGYYCQPLCDSDEMIDRWLSDLRRKGEQEAVLQDWVRLGYTHVLYYRLGAEFIRESDSRYLKTDWQALEQLLDGSELLEDVNGDYQIYEIER